MTSILLVRHGQTEWNRVERFRGRVDLELNETGMKQAKATAERIAQWPVSAIYTSPLKRALKTAQTIGQRLKLQIEPLHGLIDIDFGNWQGLSPEEVAAQNSTAYMQWLQNPQLVRFPHGESLQLVRERAAAAANDLVYRHPEATIALVSHKVVCKVLALHFLGLDDSHFWQVEQDICAVNLFEVREGIPTVLMLNDTCHLKGLDVTS